MELLQLPATISKITTMGLRSLRLQVDTQENLTDEQIQKIFAKYDKLGWFAFLEDVKIAPEQVLDLPEIESDQKKTPSQRLRSVIFVLWKQRGSKNDFEDFYRAYMEKLIEYIKSKLEPYEDEGEEQIGQGLA